MANTFKFGNGEWAVGKETALAYNDENSNFKPLPFTFDRASTATVVNKQGLIETVGIDEPRIDFLNNTKGHLLLEPSRQNVITYSEDYSNASWIKNSTGTGTNPNLDFGYTSPDGSLNATKITFNIGTGSSARDLSLFKTNISAINGVATIYLKGDTGGEDISFLAGNTRENIILTNSWKRYTLSNTSLSQLVLRLRGDQSTNKSCTIYVWGAQIEEGSYATSYIPTQGETNGVTRVVENSEQSLVTNVLDTNYNTGTIYAELKLGQDSITRFISIIGAFWTTTSIRMELTPNTSSGFVGEIVQSSVGSSVTPISTLGIASGNIIKCATSWNNGIIKIALNGVTSTGTCPLMTTRPTDLYLNLLGTFTGTGQNQKNEFRDVKIYNTALTDAELIALTS